MNKIKLCCLVDPITTENGIVNLYPNPREVVICRQCYQDLLEEIPTGIRTTESKGVWDAVIEFIHFKLKTEHTHDS